MRLSEVKETLKQEGKLDQRGLISYATLTGTVLGESFQNLVAAIFETDTLSLYRAEIDGSVGALLVSVPYCQMTKFQLRHRFLYSFTEFSAESGNFRFYSYDKNVFVRGFRDAGLLEEKK